LASTLAPESTNIRAVSRSLLRMATWSAVSFRGPAFTRICSWALWDRSSWQALRLPAFNEINNGMFPSASFWRRASLGDTPRRIFNILVAFPVPRVQAKWIGVCFLPYIYHQHESDQPIKQTETKQFGTTDTILQGNQYLETLWYTSMTSTSDKVVCNCTFTYHVFYPEKPTVNLLSTLIQTEMSVALILSSTILSRRKYLKLEYSQINKNR